jgi:hypothetical protein
VDNSKRQENKGVAAEAKKDNFFRVKMASHLDLCLYLLISLLSRPYFFDDEIAVARKNQNSRYELRTRRVRLIEPAPRNLAA